MAGSGSPCGACKFLRRKCAKGCILAPYFSDEEGATHFAAIHKIFGASNISKLLAHLPLSHRSEAAVAISYEAQARIQDPIYGCVSQIFALEQQVINLQAQLASLKAQATVQNVSYSSASSPMQEEVIGIFPSYQEECDGFFHVESLMSAQPSLPDLPSMSVESVFCYGNELVDPSSAGNHHTLSMTKEHGLNAGSSDYFQFQGMEDLQSAAFSYLNHA